MDTLIAKEKLIIQDRSIEWLCACLMLAWAFTLSMPGETFSYPSLAGFKKWGLSEIEWCGVFIVLGGGRMIALYINGRWPRSAVIRQIAALIGLLLWGQIAVMLYKAKGDAAWVPNIAISAVLAFFELMSLRRARFDERYYKRR